MKKSKSPSSDTSTSNLETLTDTISIPVVQERATISKKIVASGKVRISKKVKQEDVLVDVPVEHDEMEVKRIPINRYVKTPPAAMRYEGDTLVISVLKEVVVTEKRLMLVEELRITKRKIKETVQEKVTLRKEQVSVKRISPDSEENTSEACP